MLSTKRPIRNRHLHKVHSTRFGKGNLTTRGKRKRADDTLYHKPNIPIAIIEAKDNMKASIQQGLGYADILDIPSVYSSNGDEMSEEEIQHVMNRLNSRTRKFQGGMDRRN